MLGIILFMQVLVFIALLLLWNSHQQYIDHTHKLSVTVNRLNDLSNNLRSVYIGKCCIPGYYASDFAEYLEKRREWEK